MLRNTVYATSTENVDKHNYYGTKQQNKLYRGVFDSKKFFLSDSTS